MTLKDLGYYSELDDFRHKNGLAAFAVGRIISEHKERYVVKTAEKEYHGEVIGQLRFAAQQRSDFPAVGDWVAIEEYGDDNVLIHKILPRKSVLARQAVGKYGEKQIIATNIDYAFIMQAVDRDFNINRIERYLAICLTAKVEPIILLNKIDLIQDTVVEEMVATIVGRIQVPVLAISNTSQVGIDHLKDMLQKGKTYCLLGSSGVGKSTLVNLICGKDMMETDTISTSAQRGRHVTSHRALFVLEGGGILIDNPGMREVGVADASEGINQIFDVIVELAKQCRFKDCSHTSEKDCAILDALDSGVIDQASYDNYQKLEREKDHYNQSVADKRKKDKEFGKMVKRFKNWKNKNY